MPSASAICSWFRPLALRSSLSRDANAALASANALRVSASGPSVAGVIVARRIFQTRDAGTRLAQAPERCSLSYVSTAAQNNQRRALRREEADAPYHLRRRQGINSRIANTETNGATPGEHREVRRV